MSAQECKCVGFHAPIPVSYEIHHILPLHFGGKPKSENQIKLCPTAHRNVHELLDLLFKGPVNWDQRKHFSPYIRHIAEDGYNRYLRSHPDDN